METNLNVKIAEIATDMKWVKDELHKRNAMMERHLIESDDFRNQVVRNTVWRHTYKGVFVFVFALLIRILWIHLGR